MNQFDYYPPVSQLLTQGDCRHQIGWLDYLALGLEPDHIPELIRMALDEALHQSSSDSITVWAPIHAWRALGQMHAADAVAPLCQLFARIDEHHDDRASVLPDSGKKKQKTTETKMIYLGSVRMFNRWISAFNWAF